MPLNSRAFRRLLAIVALLLLLGPVVFVRLQLPFTIARGNPFTLIVGPGHYSRIQDAVDAAAPGDTVLVEAGSYAEHVVITKPLRLVGASPLNTTIDGSGSGTPVNITSTSGVYVSGFSIKNTGIYDNGILVWDSSNVTIQGNVVSANLQTNGTWIFNSDSSVVRGNVFTGSAYGVSVLLGFGNLIQDNNATGNPDADIYISSSSGNKVADNTLRKSLTGLQLWYRAVGNVVVRNVIANNTVYGISLLDSPGAGNLFVENSIEFNNAFNYSTGVNIQNSTLNRFYHNNILNNSYQSWGAKGGDIGLNYWDNATSLSLGGDPKIMLVDANGSGGWNANETVVYDTDNDMVYGPSDVRIASSGGSTPANGTILLRDPRVKLVDLGGVGAWRPGDPVVYDTNNNNVFDPGEPAIAEVGGNFWSNYQGLDNGANGFTGDGIGDTMLPTPCPSGGRPCSLFPNAQGVDWYPLMVMWRPGGLNVTLAAAPLGGIVPLTVVFRGLAGGGLGPYAYSWSFGDGSVAVGQNTTHTYTARGTFIVVLSVVDSVSTTGSSEVSITVMPPVGNMVLQVVDQNMVHISGANVTTTVTPQGQRVLSALTDSNGNVSFSAIMVGTYTVRAASPGFASASKNVTVVNGQTTGERLVLSRLVLPDGHGPGTGLILGVVAVVTVGLVLSFVLLRRRRDRLKAKQDSGLSVPL